GRRNATPCGGRAVYDGRSSPSIAEGPAVSEENKIEVPQAEDGTMEKDLAWWRLAAENRNKNRELLLKYERMVVAWWPDGSSIRGADADEAALRQRIEADGQDPDWYHFEYVWPFDMGFVGGVYEMPEGGGPRFTDGSD